MFNKFPCHRILVLFTLFSMSLTACNAAPTLTAPEFTLITDSTPTPQPTETETQTSVPMPTETPDPLAGAPEGATGKDSKGNYIKEVTENGHEYAYTYNVELEQWVREVGEFALYDSPYYNYIPFKIVITSDTLGERNLIQLTHKDSTLADIPPSGIYDPNPLSVLWLKMTDRYFSGDLRQLSDTEQQIAIQNEMRGEGEGEHVQAYLPIILSNGEEKLVKLSENTGITLTIMDKETLLRLGGDLVSTWHVGGITVYSEVYGVDQAGNMLARLAVEGSIADLSDEDLRKALFSFPANFVEYKDQREQGLTLFSKFVVIQSAKLYNGAPDVEIERTPLAQP